MMNKLSKILIIFIALIVLVVGGLGYYTYFVYDNGTNKTKRGDDISFDTEKLKADVVSKIGNFPYEILTDNIMNSLFDINNATKVYSTIKLLKESDYIKVTDIYNNDTYVIDTKTLVEKDSDGKKYPDYTSTKDEMNVLRLFAQRLELTVAEIKKMDLKLWEPKDIITNNVIILDSNLVKTEVIKLFKNSESIFNVSWKETGKVSSLFGITIIYDKNINKVFIIQTPANFPDTLKVIKVIETKEEENSYSFKIIAAPLSIKGEGQVLTTSEGDINIVCTDKCGDIDDKTLYQYKEKLDKYQILFEKVNDTYQFQTIKKVDA